MSQKFNISIPNFLILDEDKKHDSLNFNLLDNKIILGLVGYAKSGKDTIANKFVKKYGYHRIAFADNLKIEMNKYMRELVYEDLNMLVSSKDPIHIPLEKIDFTTEDLVLKRRLRPYIIWYGELMRELNGAYYWINKAFENDARGYDKLIISDVRRLKELDVFEDSNSFRKKSEMSFASAGYFHEDVVSEIKKVKPYSSLLFYVNQYGLLDDDVLTKETILKAQEKWMFDDTFYIDSRLPNNDVIRNTSIDNQIKKISDKFGIKKPDYTISKKQLKMF
jgi:hypothetical protein